MYIISVVKSIFLNWIGILSINVKKMNKPKPNSVGIFVLNHTVYWEWSNFI